MGQLRGGLDPHQLPAPDVQHDRPGGHRWHRDDRLLHARRLRLRALPVPGPRRPVPRCSLSTIFLPAAVTLIPTYTIFVNLGWVGTWLPLLVPAFFANAYDVFLLRQYFMTLPREIDDAAKIDGAGPMRILLSVIVPQAWPVIIAVSIFHLVYSWNLYFEPLLYLSTAPGPAADFAGPLQVQRHLRIRAAVHPGGHAHDDRDPDGRLLLRPEGLHARHRDHRRREVTERRASRSPSTPSTRIAHTTVTTPPGSSTSWAAWTSAPRSSCRVAGSKPSPTWRGESPPMGT